MGNNVYLGPNLRDKIGWKFHFRPNRFQRVVYEGKFKLFGPSAARAKKFEFAQVNHKFDQLCVKKIIDL